MKRKLFLILSVFLILILSPVSALAVNKDQTYDFKLTVDGGDTKEVKTGDIITVVLELSRTDSTDAYTMYAMQDEIRYDSNFFELVEGSIALGESIASTDIAMRDEYREFYMNYLSLTGGEPWEATTRIGSFQLRVTGTSGVTHITNQDYRVSVADGSDSYDCRAGDVTIILSSECVVHFESNGGSKVEDVMAIYGEPLERPEDPKREGYTFAGWFKDIDLKNEWDFDQDTVTGNMTLYAKWEKAEDPGLPGNPDIPGTGSGMNLWWALLAGILLLILGLILLLLFVLQKKVRFVVEDTVVKTVRVKRGGKVQIPNIPIRNGAVFDGWYQDSAYRKPWDFEEDSVTENITLFGKWK